MHVQYSSLLYSQAHHTTVKPSKAKEKYSSAYHINVQPIVADYCTAIEQYDTMLNYVEFKIV